MKKGLLAGLTLALLLWTAPVSAATPVLAWHRFHGWWGGGWGWGWGWGYPGYWGPYYAPYGYGYGYGYGRPGMSWAAIDTGVSPEEARVYLDGRYIGIADDFDGFPDYLYLKKGHYRLEFRLEGYQTRAIDFDAQPGRKLKIDDKLEKIPGAKRYGSYDTPEPPGGVRRFWTKRRDATEAVTDPAEIYGSEGDRENGQDRGRGEPGASSQDRGPAREGQARSPESRRSAPGEGWRGESGSAGREAASRLTIHAEPSDAAIYLDDRFIGTADEVEALDRGIRVEAGDHTVTVSRPGYRDKTVRVEVGGGKSESVEVKLEK